MLSRFEQIFTALDHYERDVCQHTDCGIVCNCVVEKFTFVATAAIGLVRVCVHAVPVLGAITWSRAPDDVPRRESVGAWVCRRHPFSEYLHFHLKSNNDKH